MREILIEYKYGKEANRKTIGMADTNTALTALLSKFREMVGEEEESSDNYTYGDTSYLAKAVIYGKNELRKEILSKLEKL